MRAPVLVALRRLRERRLAAATIVVAVAAAGALVGWSSLAAAIAQEHSVRLRLDERPAAARALRVVYYTPPLEQDADAATVAVVVDGLRALTEPAHHVRVWHPILPADERGTRLVLVRDPRDAVVAAGRRPAGACRPERCEALALTGRYRVGQRVRLRGTSVRVVGLGSLRTVALGDRAQLGSRSLVVTSLDRQLRRLSRRSGSTDVTTAPLDPGAVHAYGLAGLTARLRATVVRLDRSDPNGLLQATAPLGLLTELDRRGRTARDRLLLVAGEGAALVLAFAFFAAGTRRRDADTLRQQLETLGASRAQVVAAHVVESAIPALVGATLAVAGVVVAARAVARAHGWPGAFATAAVPGRTVLAIAAVGVAAAVLLLAAATPRPRLLGVGTLEAAALVALGLVVWQTAANGGLDAERVAAHGADPVLLLVPALAFFATAVLLLRLLPLVLRAAERAARHAPPAVRLAFLDAARNPAQAAAATTFLAVAVGGALFSLDYRATLDAQARDAAAFTAGARWRVVERSAARPFGATDVTPVTRYAAATSERATRVLRLPAKAEPALPTGSELDLQLVGVPAGRLADLRGWRNSFSHATRSGIARRLRPAPVRLHGVRFPADATALRAWTRAQTRFPRRLVLHFLLPGGGFAHVPGPQLAHRWRRLAMPLPRAVRRAELVGIEFLPLVVPLGVPPDLAGFVDLARVELRSGRTWRPLPSLDDWVAAGDSPAAQTSAGGGGYLVTGAQFEDNAPVRTGLELDLNGTLAPLIRPSLRLPPALPALVGPAVAARAVDGVVTVEVDGRPLALRVAAHAGLFPTVTSRPRAFAVVDYDTLFATLNADTPGFAVPSEAWFFDEQPAAFRARLAHAPFRLDRAVGARELQARLLDDPLARGTRSVLGVALVVAAVLALAGLVLAARARLAAERALHAEYEALGVARTTLARAAQLGLVTLALLGVLAGAAGGVLAVRLIGAFVAVTGGASRPLPPIVPHVPWAAGAALVLAVGALGVAATALLARRALREPAAGRLRA